MTEQQTSPSVDAAADARGAILRQFWLDSVKRLVALGASEREVALQMLVVAAAHVGKTCGDEGAAQLCSDQALFYWQCVKHRQDAAAEAEASIHH